MQYTINILDKYQEKIIGEITHKPKNGEKQYKNTRKIQKTNKSKENKKMGKKKEKK